MGPLMYELTRTGLALFYSGIFWMMVWYLVENRRTPPEDRKPLVPLAVALMLGTVYLMLGVVAHADAGAPRDVVAALQRGGLVLVMRHASAPRETPTAEQADPENRGLERQLDVAGRRGASAFGDALRALGVPVGAVWCSPTYRARQTVGLAKLSRVTFVDELGDAGQSMAGVSDAQAAWLRAKVGERPVSGNTVIVTHMPNLARAFPEWGAVADGEMVVLSPDGTTLGRIAIDEWPTLR